MINSEETIGTINNEDQSENLNPQLPEINLQIEQDIQNSLQQDKEIIPTDLFEKLNTFANRLISPKQRKELCIGIVIGGLIMGGIAGYTSITQQDKYLAEVPSITLVSEVPIDNINFVHNTSELQSFASWVEGDLVPKLDNPKIGWSGGIKVGGLKTQLGVLTDTEILVDDNNQPMYIEMKDVRINNRLTPEQAKLVVTKEIIGNYVFLEWWLANPDYIKVDDPEIQSLIDGMAYNYLATDLKEGFPILKNLKEWDGKQKPTCEHLQAISLLHKTNSVEGPGIDNLLQKNCPFNN